MSIKVLFFASLAEAAGTRELILEPASLTDLKSVFEKCAKERPLLESHRASVLFALNSEFARPDAPVKDGDEVAFFPPVSGG